MRPINAENKMMIVTGKLGVRGWAKWVKGTGRYRLPVTKGKSHGNKRYIIGIIVNDIVIALYGDRWELHL